MQVYKFRPSIRLGVAIFGIVVGILFLVGFFRTMMPALGFAIVLVLVSVVAAVLVIRKEYRKKKE